MISNHIQRTLCCMKYFEFICICLLLIILGILTIENVNRVFNLSAIRTISETSEKLIVTSNNVAPKTTTDGSIPKNIFQTWQDKKLPKKMTECVNSITKCNPEFHHYLYDDAECYEFIKTHYDSDVLYAYDSLIPGAYKADLWRCCVLFKYGGVYLDIKYKCINGFSFENLLDSEYFVKDLYETNNRKAVYNALIVVKPGNAILEKTIKQIVENVRNRYYGTCPLDITGPTMMIKQFTPSEEKHLGRLELVKHNWQLYICFMNKPILMMYPEYRSEQRRFSEKGYYAELWKDRNVYE
jgi:mannosyltransferase OCH1-like enzyme